MTDKKVALVTGGSRGIGKACALELAKAGCDVVINFAGNAEAAAKTVEELKALGSNSESYKFDVSNQAEVDENIAKIVEKYGRIDVLINNAGITRDDLFIRMGEDKWNAVINTNLNSAFYVSKPVVKLMMKQRSGAIVNMSSVVGLYGNAGQANYSAAKAGLIGFTKSVAREVAARGVRVNAIAPGFIESDMTDAIPEKMKDAMIAQVPMKRIGQAEEVAEVAAFLASQEYLTGQTIAIDGGMTMQ